MTSPSQDRLFGVNASMAVKVPCRVATTAAITLNGEQTIDGVAVVTGDRVLVKDQASGVYNGIYVADTSDWERDLDMDGSRDIVEGTLVKVNHGTAGPGFYYVTTTGTIVVGTTSIAFALASSVLAVLSAFGQTLVDDANAAAARTTLGLGTIATQAASAVSITGGTMAAVTITGGSITGMTDIAIADGGTAASTAAAAFSNLKQDATSSATGVIEHATQAEVSAGTAGNLAVLASHNTITLGTESTTTGGTSIDFTGIPAGVRRIEIAFVGVSTSGTSPLIIQIGDSGGIETSVYASAAGNNAANTASTAGFILVPANVAAALYNGVCILLLEDSSDFTWVGCSCLGEVATPRASYGAGSKALSAELTQLRITTAGGSETFDLNGGINITYQR